jgi:hypothetical protein
MPSKRAPNQKLIAFPIDDELAGLMDRARGTMNRSQFIRDAIARMLGVPAEMGRAPDRVKSDASTVRLNVTLNEEPGYKPQAEKAKKSVDYKDAIKAAKKKGRKK